MRVELRDGHWAELRDPETLTNGQRKPLMKAIAAANPTPNAQGEPTIDPAAVLDVNEAMLSTFVGAWSYPFPVPSADPGSYDQLPALASDQLTMECGKLMDRAILDTEKPGTPPT